MVPKKLNQNNVLRYFGVFGLVFVTSVLLFVTEAVAEDLEQVLRVEKAYDRRALRVRTFIRDKQGRVALRTIREKIFDFDKITPRQFETDPDRSLRRKFTPWAWAGYHPFPYKIEWKEDFVAKVVRTRVPGKLIATLPDRANVMRDRIYFFLDVLGKVYPELITPSAPKISPSPNSKDGAMLSDLVGIRGVEPVNLLIGRRVIGTVPYQDFPQTALELEIAHAVEQAAQTSRAVRLIDGFKAFIKVIGLPMDIVFAGLDTSDLMEQAFDDPDFGVRLIEDAEEIGVAPEVPLTFLAGSQYMINFVTMGLLNNSPFWDSAEFGPVYWQRQSAQRVRDLEIRLEADAREEEIYRRAQESVGRDVVVDAKTGDWEIIPVIEVKDFEEVLIAAIMEVEADAWKQVTNQVGQGGLQPSGDVVNRIVQETKNLVEGEYHSETQQKPSSGATSGSVE